MFKFCFGILFIGLTNAGNIQSGGYNYEQLGLSARMSNSLKNRMGMGSGYGSGYGSLGLSGNSAGLGYSGQPSGPLSAAIHSKRFYRVIPVPSNYEPAIPQVIEVGPSEQPVHIIFRSISSPVMVQQIHTPGSPGQSESTHSEDEPHRVLHEVVRPVIQEVREVIQPYRRVTQEVRPVLEEVHTVVAKGEGHRGALSGPAIAGNSGALPLNLDSGKGQSGLGLKGAALSDGDLSLADAYSGGAQLAYQPMQYANSASDYSSAKKSSK